MVLTGNLLNLTEELRSVIQVGTLLITLMYKEMSLVVRSKSIQYNCHILSETLSTLSEIALSGIGNLNFFAALCPHKAFLSFPVSRNALS